MSGQWEVVGKKKDKNAKLAPAKNGKDAKKKQLPNGPKLEDVLPMSQVKNLYASTGKSNKENQKPANKNKVAENGQKKAEKKKEKPQEQPKPKPPKSIEAALNAIDAEEFEKLFEKTKTLFPDAPVVWMKELAQFLNQKVPVEIQDVVFSNRNEAYPLNIIPAPIKAIIEKSVTSAGQNHAQLFYDCSITSMATDMNKGYPALGHKFYLQYLAHKDPKIVVSGMNKHIELRKSYVNRQPIGLSILWALSQSGIKDFNVGLQVFQDIMLPIIDMKNYSRYVIKYLVELIKRHKTAALTKDQYLVILDIIFGNNRNIPNELQQELLSVLPDLRAQLFLQKNNDRYHTFVDPLLKKMQSIDNKSYRNELCEVLISCLQKDKTAFGCWTKLYTKYLAGSTVLLQYLDTHWNKVSSKLNAKVFKDVLNTYAVTNEELSLKKRKDEVLIEGTVTIKKLTTKMATKKSSGFPFKTLLFFLVVSSVSLVLFDIKQNGSWEKSRTLKTAKELGVYEYTLKAVDRSKQGAFWVNGKLQETFPDYHKVASDYLEPFVDLAQDMLLIAGNTYQEVKTIVIEKYPVVIKSIESYAPRLFEQSQQAVKSILSTSTLYFNRSVDFLKKEVFTGQLSPENMQKVFMQAFNTTQQKATEYYHWLYEKVQTTIK